MSEIKNSLWVEKYRPSSLDSYIGNKHLKSKVKLYLESGDLPHLLLFGRAGTGYINASDENSVEVVRDKVKNFASTLGFANMKVIILDECDYITPNAQAALRNLMETFSKSCRFILTCNYVERIIDPIQSRCQSFQIIPPDRKEVAVHLNSILTKEKVDADIEDIVTIVNGGFPDLRRVINAAQRQVVDNKLVIDEGMSIQNDYKVISRFKSNRFL